MQELLHQWASLKQAPLNCRQTVNSVEQLISQELAILEKLKDDGCLEIAGEPLAVPGLILIHQRMLEELQELQPAGS